MARKIISPLIICICIIFWLSGCRPVTPDLALTAAGPRSGGAPGVWIEDRGGYFFATLDYARISSRREMGGNFGTAILEAVPDYESLVDTYLAESVVNQGFYRELMYRVVDLRRQLSPAYREELDGLAGVFHGTANIRGDGRLSRDEVYLFNLFPDACRGTQCCFVSVFGSRSATGSTMAARGLDWYGGDKNQLPRIQGVIMLRYPGGWICSVGYLGYLGILTGFSDEGVFAAVLDADSGASYSSLGKCSYPFDLRTALEQKKSLGGVAGFMIDPARNYAFNHLIALADSSESKVLENNFSGNGATDERVRRALRTAGSALNKNVKWGFANAIAAVNSFLLAGNHDNQTPFKFNTKRWANLRRELAAAGPVVTPEELMRVASYDGGAPGTFSDSGDLYNRMTQQIVVFEPASMTLLAYFRPRRGQGWPRDPVFTRVSLEPSRNH